MRTKILKKQPQVTANGALKLLPKQVAMAASVADEALGNIRTVRAFAMETKEHELYIAELEKASDYNLKLGLGIAFFQGAANFALNGKFI